MNLKRSTVGALGLAAALLLGACASRAAPGGQSGAGAGGGGGTSPKLGTSAVAGIGMVLQTPSGFTLYFLTTETNGKIACTGDCASAWPPLLATSGKVPEASPDVAPHLGTITRPDSSVQVTYRGKPLYTYAGDKSPGETKGQGVGGVWFAVTTAGGTSSPSGSGYPGY